MDPKTEQLDCGQIFKSLEYQVQELIFHLSGKGSDCKYLGVCGSCNVIKLMFQMFQEVNL